MLFIAIVCPPVYFICVKKWGMFAITAFMALLGFALIFFVVPFLLLWAIAIVMAVHDYKKVQQVKMLDEHAKKVGQAVAANMHAGTPSSLPHGLAHRS
jgi:uncharacterized membrane protein